MRVSVHPSRGPRPHRTPSRGLIIGEGLVALVLLVVLIAGLAAIITWAAVLGMQLLFAP
ncbi:MAG: hypothetical protein J2P22_08240 [Nocardioides sp.]|nr:hypothetical protein [Nocardioides sp.]